MKKYSAIILGCLLAVLCSGTVKAEEPLSLSEQGQVKRLRQGEEIYVSGNRVEPLNVEVCYKNQGPADLKENVLYSNQALYFQTDREDALECHCDYQVVNEGEGYEEADSAWTLFSQDGICLDQPDGWYRVFIRRRIFIPEGLENSIEIRNVDIREGAAAWEGTGVTGQQGVYAEMKEYRICFDRGAPKLQVVTEANLEQWQREDIICEVQAEDLLSGVEDITILREDEVPLKEQKPAGPKSEHMKKELKLEKETPAEGLKFEIRATDAAGNEAVYQGHYFLDKTAPVLSVSGLTDGQLSAVPGQLMFTVTEDIYEFASVRMDASRLYEGVARQTEGADHKLKGKETSFSRIFDQDGIYTVQLQASDAAGNCSEDIRLVFRVDVTAPVINIQGPSQDGRYCTEKELQIEIEEEFYQGNQVSIRATKSFPGKSEEYMIGAWNNDQKRSKLSHTFREDGRYSIRVDAVDEAGHHAESKQMTFVIDRNAPVIEIEGITDQALVSKLPVLRFYSEELFYDDQIVTIVGSVTGMDQNRRDIDFPKFEGTGVYSQMQYAVDTDGVYQIVMHAADIAQNTAQIGLSFICDSTPPEIGYLDTINRTYQERFALPKDFDNYIRDLTEVNYRIYVNQELIRKEQVITEPGKYIITVEATDAAGNLAVKTAEWIIPEKEEEKFTDIQENGIPMTGTGEALTKDDEAKAVETEQTEVKKIEADQKDRAAGQIHADREMIKKKIIYGISLFIGISVITTAIFRGLRRIDRKKGT